MEKDWGHTLDMNGSIENIRIKSLYDGVCKRPTGFDISYTENGEIKYRYVDNTPRPTDLVKNGNGVAYNWEKPGAQA